MRRFEPGTFPVASVSGRRLSSLMLTETRYGSRTSLPLHAHERACIVVLFEGSFTEDYADGRRVCTAPTILARPPEEPHADRFGEGGGRVLNVEIPDGWPAADAAGALPRVSGACAGPERERLAVGFLRGYRAGPANGCRAARLGSEALTAWTRAVSAPARVPPAVERARSIVEEGFRSTVSLSRVAAEVGMHPASLARAFRRTHGESLGQRVRRLRVREACRLLLGSRASLTEVALSVGFWDQAHFTRSFRGLVGVTPGEFARLLRA